MRLLLVSDLHYSLKQLDWVTRSAPDFDVVVIAGDLLDIRSYVEPDAQIAVVREYLARMSAQTTVVVCSGNHDLNARNDDGERAALWLAPPPAEGVHIDGARVATDDVFITVCPWWDGPRTHDHVDAALAADAAVVDGRYWIWVYHAPPDHSPTSWTGTRYYGDADLTVWVNQHHPDLVLTGHVHQSPFVDGGGWADHLGSTWFINAGHEGGPRPAHVVIDTNARTAQWQSSEGADEIALGAQYSGSGSRSEPS